jgi:hypothetical protein
MMQRIDVDGLRFEFDNTWRALKWDDHHAYRGGLNGHNGTKAIDIVALRHEDQLWLIEGGSIRTAAARIRFKNKRAAKRRISPKSLQARFVTRSRHRCGCRLVIPQRPRWFLTCVPLSGEALEGSRRPLVRRTRRG